MYIKKEDTLNQSSPNIIKPGYFMGCYECGTTKSLMMISHRNVKDNSKIVGWLFVCSKCFPKLQDHLLQIDVINNKL